MEDIHKMVVRRTAHIYSSGIANEASYSWLACHGYGQLARKFIKEFSLLEKGPHYLLAPEGLSKFYWNGFEGPVVASWMTREHRLDEIRDQADYLHKVYAMMPSRSQRVLLGFSQGVATVARYLYHTRDSFDHIVLWGGSLPEDVDYEGLLASVSSGQIILIFGDADPFFTSERIEEQKKLLEKAKVPFQILAYPGGHDVTSEGLELVMKQIGISS